MHIQKSIQIISEHIDDLTQKLMHSSWYPDQEMEHDQQYGIPSYALHPKDDH